MDEVERSLLGTLSYYLNPFHAKRHELRTTLSVADCASRLSDAIRASEQVDGSASNRRFRVNRTIHYRNSFQTLATGRFYEGPDGTRVSVRLAIHVGVAVFTLIWVVFALNIAGVLLWACVSGEESCRLESPLPIAFPILGLGVHAFGRGLARGEGGYLLEFLKATLHAEELPPS